MTPIASRLAALALVAFLTAPAIAAVFGIEVREFENRTLAAPPSWRESDWLDAETYRVLTAFLRDRVPLRKQATKLDSWIDYRVLGDSPTQAVAIGEDGELFYRRAIVHACGPITEPGPNAHAIRRLSDALIDRGIEVFVVISPTKTWLAADRLPRSLSHYADCLATRHRVLREELSKPASFELVELWDAFAGVDASGTEIFPKRGYHWRDTGELLQCQLVIEAIRPGLWEEDAVESLGILEKPSELPRRFMNLELLESSPAFRLQRPGVETDFQLIKLPPPALHHVAVLTSTSMTRPLLPGTTVVLHDSFMAVWFGKPWLAAYGEKTVYIHWDDVFTHLETASELLIDADRVVLQLAEDLRGAALHPGKIEALRVGLRAARARKRARPRGTTQRRSTMTFATIVSTGSPR